MKIDERIRHIETEMAANPKNPSIIIPVEHMKTLIRHHCKYSELKEKSSKYRAAEKWYREAHKNDKAEIRRLKSELAKAKEELQRVKKDRIRLLQMPRLRGGLPPGEEGIRSNKHILPEMRRESVH